MSTSLGTIQPSGDAPPQNTCPQCHRAPLRRPTWPFSEGSQFACLSDDHMQVPWGPRVHLHENWACGTMNPPIGTRCRISALGRSDMSKYTTLVTYDLIFPLAHQLRTMLPFVSEGGSSGFPARDDCLRCSTAVNPAARSHSSTHTAAVGQRKWLARHIRIPLLASALHARN